jgi:hypothetical protein
MLKYLELDTRISNKEIINTIASLKTGQRGFSYILYILTFLLSYTS